MLAIVGASGKIGGATMDALLSYHLIPASQLICLTSARNGDSKWQTLAAKGVQVRHASFDSPTSMEAALRGCDRLFLVSSPRIEMDFGNAPYGSGREKDHFVAIDAAERAGVHHIYYTSLAFANPSRAGVMVAHMRTEAYLKEKWTGGWTIIREGLYNESWPLYFGHYSVGKDERTEIVVAGDGPLCWTSIADLGLATGVVLSQPSEHWNAKVFYLSSTKDPKTLTDIAKIVSEVTGKGVKLKVTTREEHERHHIQDRGLSAGEIKWWASTYDALRDEECLIADTTLEELLQQVQKTPKPLADTVKETLKIE